MALGAYFPQKRKRERSGIERAPRRDWPGHRAYIRTHRCACDGRNGHVCSGPIQAAHLRSGIPAEDAGGTGMKPHDKWTWPACEGLHQEQHERGEETVQAKYGINLHDVCLKMQAGSPHRHRWTEAT